MRFGVPGDSELMATVQECSNWGLALVSGQTTTLLNLSSEENNTFVGWLGVYAETAHLFLLPELWLSDWISVWLDGLCLHYFLLEKLRERVKLTLRLSVSWPIGSVIHITKHSTIRSLHCVTKSLLSFCLFCACSSLVIMYCDPRVECDRCYIHVVHWNRQHDGSKSHESAVNAPCHCAPTASSEELQATPWVNLLLPCGL